MKSPEDLAKEIHDLKAEYYYAPVKYMEFSTALIRADREAVIEKVRTVFKNIPFLVYDAEEGKFNSGSIEYDIDSILDTLKAEMGRS